MATVDGGRIIYYNCTYHVTDKFVNKGSEVKVESYNVCNIFADHFAEY